MGKNSYHERNKCRICKRIFSEQSCHGNPYKWCPQCREKKYSEFEKLCKRIKEK